MQTVLSRLLLAAVSLAIFMEALDTTILNTAIPTIASSLHIAPLNLKIALISYLISLAIFMPVSGWAADYFGAKRVFITAIAIFTLSSFWCGWSTTVIELIIARALQGLGGALMLPVGRLIILRLVEKKDFTLALNRVVLPALIGPALGPLVGGFIVTHFFWSWIFWINLPIGIGAIFLSWRYLPAMAKQPKLPLDIMGFLWFGSSLAMMTFSLGLLSENNTPLLLANSLLIMGTLSLLSYFQYARRQTAPFIQLSLFKLRIFRISLIGNFIARLGFGSMPFLIPLLLQLSLQYSPQIGGMISGTMAIGAMAVKLFVRRLIRRWRFRRLLLTNTVLLAMMESAYALINSHTALWLIGLMSLLFGFLTSLQYSTMNPLTYAEPLPQDTGAATSLLATLQQIGSSFSIALAALILKYFADSTHHLTLTAFHYTFIILGLLTLTAFYSFQQLQPNDGSNLY